MDAPEVAEDPPYVKLHRRGELARRAADALRLLEGRCTVCPRACKVDRLHDERALCAIGRRAVVASHFPHRGEEDCLRGTGGSGTIFFSGCNLRCVFCQNFDISWGPPGAPVPAHGLAEMMLELQSWGCHNINLVTPEHVVPQILEALPVAVEAGLRLPIVYNTSAYDSLDSLAMMDGVVSVYMPDFKLWTRERARRLLRRADYPDVARRTIPEMHRQVGPLTFDERGLAVRGVLLRHLVMPGMFDETEAILSFVAEHLGPGTYVNLMPQYRPGGLVHEGRYPEIARTPSSKDFERAVASALDLRLRVDERSAMQARALRR